MLILTQIETQDINVNVDFILPLTAEERNRSRQKLTLVDRNEVFLRLPRGTVLHNGDIISDEIKSHFIRIIAKPEPVLTLVADTPLLLLRAAYHLGNRHVPVEITDSYLRLSPDSVLRTMLEKLGLEIRAEVVPFYPELGAYGGNYGHDHSHS
jgi:urease accessory protein